MRPVIAIGDNERVPVTVPEPCRSMMSSRPQVVAAVVWPRAGIVGGRGAGDIQRRTVQERPGRSIDRNRVGDGESRQVEYHDAGQNPAALRSAIQNVGGSSVDDAVDGTVKARDDSANRVGGFR